MRKHSDHPVLLFLLFLVEERRKTAGPRATILQASLKWRPAFSGFRSLTYVSNGPLLTLSDSYCGISREKRLASKTINSLLAQNGEPELDKR